MNEIAQQTGRVFRERFNREPRLYFSPGRINLIGEHIDYNDGFVLPAAIDKGIYFALAPNGSDLVNFYSIDFEEGFSTPLKGIGKNSGWRNYLLGVLNEFLLLGKPVGGFDCVFAGDIPIGSGMSSSAAAEGGLAFAINDLYHFGLNRVELALLCQRAEHNFPGVQCGIMDQFANMMGKAGQVILLDCRDLQHRYFPLPADEYGIMLVNSMVKHSLASGEYNVRRQQCEEGLAVLRSEAGIHSFRDIEDLQILESCRKKMTEVTYRRCRYVIEEIARTKKAAVLLQQNNLPGFGELMFASHAGLRDGYEVSCPELDFLVETARNLPFVIGSRMMGGGFGGCTINLVRKSNEEIFANAIQSGYSVAFDIEAEVYAVEVGGGTGEL